ncbi:MAG: hypothetical protein ABFS32_22795 [Bacteroidota bacterium]
MANVNLLGPLGPICKMTINVAKYTEEEILEIFKEQHRLCSPHDPEADPMIEITADMNISEWRQANDLVNWRQLGTFLNKEFRINISEDTWHRTLEPSKSRKLRQVCQLISQHADRDTYESKTLLGKRCLEAGVFLTIKRNLSDKGVDVWDLSPSSLIEDYMNKYFSQILEEATLTGTKMISEIHIERKKKGF